MKKNIVPGFVLVALIIMILLSYLQKHEEECFHGRLLKTLRPCGSVSHSI